MSFIHNYTQKQRIDVKVVSNCDDYIQNEDEYMKCSNKISKKNEIALKRYKTSGNYLSKEIS